MSQNREKGLDALDDLASALRNADYAYLILSQNLAPHEVLLVEASLESGDWDWSSQAASLQKLLDDWSPA